MSGKEKGKDKEKDDDDEKVIDDWKAALGYFVLRVCDSAYMPWALVAVFCVALVWVLTRHLESGDALKLLWSIGSLSGLAWFGWVVALLEIPIARWVLNRSIRDRDKEIHRLKQENARARKLLPKTKQAELDLGPEKGD